MIIPNLKQITQKRLRQLSHGRVSEKTNIWRQTVLARDNYKCQFGNCNEKDNLQVHHIKKYSQYMHLRYDPLNGIALCPKHHQIVTGHEKRYEIQFMKTALINNARYKNQQKQEQDNPSNSS